MSIELEYAVKKDIRNNSVVRQADARQRGELWRMAGTAMLVVTMLLFSAWQHNNRLEAAIAVERRRSEQERELAVNRVLRLNLEQLRAPETLARHAGRLGLRPATLSETVVIERVHQPTDAGSFVASAR
jgi:hypothetical protein